jgi:hypothetical protein
MKTLVQSLILGITLVSFTTAFAEEEVQKKKTPRHSEVKNRAAHQQKRIRAGVRDGQISDTHATDERKNLKNVKTEAREDVKENEGDLTKKQHVGLNKELNKNSKEIHTDKVPAPANGN